ncbi:uncharacterized protein LOC118647905 [Monomorium pharaonis]|uniref:uncharacterized protein LOC118647905 n=1 Tax=Monomorium pharaonis TaxID=307658 RepID=UPI0017462C45|nr:uncharacterized protein LOC118647905 [Monomorium pharaonis]
MRSILRIIFNLTSDLINSILNGNFFYDDWHFYVHREIPGHSIHPLFRKKRLKQSTRSTARLAVKDIEILEHRLYIRDVFQCTSNVTTILLQWIPPDDLLIIRTFNVGEL